MKSKLRVLMLLVFALLVIAGLNQLMSQEKEAIKQDQIVLNKKVVIDESRVSQLVSDDDSWFKVNGDISFDASVGSLKTHDRATSEVWLKYLNTFDASKDFKVSAHVKVPRSWENHSDKNAQVGIGLFVGKDGDGGKLVYESDLCVIAKEMRFVQGQMVKNRKGEDPVEVGMIEVNEEEGVLSIVYSSDKQSLSLYFNDRLVDSQSISESGAVDWKMASGDKFVVGIMGFSENVIIDTDFPSIASITIEHNH